MTDWIGPPECPNCGAPVRCEVTKMTPDSGFAATMVLYCENLECEGPIPPDEVRIVLPGQQTIIRNLWETRPTRPRVVHRRYSHETIDRMAIDPFQYEKAAQGRFGLRLVSVDWTDTYATLTFSDEPPASWPPP